MILIYLFICFGSWSWVNHFIYLVNFVPLLNAHASCCSFTGMMMQWLYDGNCVPLTQTDWFSNVLQQFHVMFIFIYEILCSPNYLKIVFKQILQTFFFYFYIIINIFVYSFLTYDFVHQFKNNKIVFKEKINEWKNKRMKK